MANTPNITFTDFSNLISCCTFFFITFSQPFFSRCKRYLICFNGEIVNYNELVKFLLQKKIKMTNKNEVEVILELYLHYGEECLRFLKGMFAFVIIDKISGKIFAASDRFGIKPIYYGYINNKKCFYITSNFSSLVTTNIVEKRIDHLALEQFISFGQIYDSKTLINDFKPPYSLKLKKHYNQKTNSDEVNLLTYCLFGNILIKQKTTKKHKLN